MAMSAAAGVTNLTSAEVLMIEPLRNVCFAALDEALAIAHSQNIELDRSEVLKGLGIMTATGGSGENKPSLCLDILARRPGKSNSSMAQRCSCRCRRSCCPDIEELLCTS